MKPIWIVDDDQSIRFVLEKALMREGLPIRSFTNMQEVVSALNRALRAELPQVLLSDIRMPGGSGLELLKMLKKDYPHIPVIIMTAYSDLDSAVSAFQGGAFEYIAKPFDLNALVELVHRAMEESLSSDAEAVNVNEIEVTEDIIGKAPAMQNVFRVIGRLSQSHVTVLITGESGTGKELVAHALHKHSPRASGPFIAINTAAIPKDLLESELFGHEKGAFTGAQSLHKGRFEQAEGGTLFLDEIGDMPFDLQTRLLRVLSDGHFYRVGGHVAIKSNVRIIAATHQLLEERVKQGVFREDLFHRLNVIRLQLPSIKERKEDIPLLVQHFLKRSAQQLGGEPKRVTGEALKFLCKFSYPGNIRQLENMCHWLTVMTPTQLIQIKDLPLEVLQEAQTKDQVITTSVISGKPGFATVADDEAVHAKTRYPDHLTTDGLPVASFAWEAELTHDVIEMLRNKQPEVWDKIIKRIESCLITAALQMTRGRRIEAATILGIGRNTITRKIQELGLDE